MILARHGEQPPLGRSSRAPSSPRAVLLVRLFRRRHLVVRLPPVGCHQLRAAGQLHPELDPPGRHRRAPEHQQLLHHPQSLWEPLIAYDGSTGTVALEQGRLAGHRRRLLRRTARASTITLDDRHWSDGEPITSRDVEFWFNLVKANKARLGQLQRRARRRTTGPSSKTVDDTHFTLTFDQAYNQQWMLANELSHDHADAAARLGQDRATGRRVGRSTAPPRAPRRSWTYLNGAAKKISGYATNPLWKTVSGPYTIKAFSTPARSSCSPRTPSTTAATRPTSRHVNLLPFTTTDAEVNASGRRRSTTATSTPTDLSQEQVVHRQGYTVKPWTGWADHLHARTTSTTRPWARSSSSSTSARRCRCRWTRPRLSKVSGNGTAVPGYGPVPQGQSSTFVSPDAEEEPVPVLTCQGQGSC